MIATYQTRIAAYAGLDREAGDAALAAFGELYGRMQRKLFAERAAGPSAPSLKSEYLVRHGIPGRLFNAVRFSLDGKVKAVKAGRGLLIDDLRRRIAKAKRRIVKAERRGDRFAVHRKRRRLAILERRLKRLEAEEKAGLVRLCFGSKRLWRRQHDLEANGYGSHEEWLEDWREARSGEFFVMGSRDETAGCQLCVAAVQDDGSLTLRLRMPDCLAGEHGKYLTVEGVRFAYGHEQVLAALESNAGYAACRRERGERAARATGLGQAVSYRFKRDARGWRVFVSTETMDVPVTTDRRLGAVGVDLNADHLAVAETDASGNCVRAFSVPLVTYGKTTEQAKALIGDAAARVVEHALSAGKPVVVERLDFRRKKAALEDERSGYARMLSSFAYAKIVSSLLSRASRFGVEVRQVNPAYSSIVGRAKFMGRYGLSGHQAAALVLARRSLGLSERVPRRRVLPDGKGGQVAFRVPARKRVKHVWSHWHAISKGSRPAHAACQRPGRSRDGPDPARASSSGDGLGGDPFAGSGRDSRTEPLCTVGAAARPLTASSGMDGGGS